MADLSIIGRYRDRLIDPIGNVTFDSNWQSNTIVHGCRMLLAGFLKNEEVFGIQSVRIGRGDPLWDTSPPPSPDPLTTNQLTDTDPYVIPEDDLQINFINSDGNIVTSPTNRIEIITTIGPGQPTPDTEPPFPLREFGLFAEMNTEVYMINCIRHPLIEKDGSLTLERRIRLIF